MPAKVLRELGFENMDEFLDWRGTRRCYAGYLRNEASHQIDTTNWVLGKPSEVRANGVCLSDKSGHLDSIDSLLDYPTAFSKPVWRAHLENFFRAIGRHQRGEPPRLNCPAREGFNTTLTCLKIEEAATSNQPLRIGRRVWL